MSLFSQRIAEIIFSVEGIREVCLFPRINWMLGKFGKLRGIILVHDVNRFQHFQIRISCRTIYNTTIIEFRPNETSVEA